MNSNKRIIMFEDRLRAFNRLAIIVDTELANVPGVKEAFERAAQKTGFGPEASWRSGRDEKLEENND